MMSLAGLAVFLLLGMGPARAEGTPPDSRARLLNELVGMKVLGSPSNHWSALTGVGVLIERDWRISPQSKPSLSKALKATITHQEILEEEFRLWNESLSEQELASIHAFFTSDLGKRFVAFDSYTNQQLNDFARTILESRYEQVTKLKPQRQVPQPPQPPPPAPAPSWLTKTIWSWFPGTAACVPTK